MMLMERLSQNPLPELKELLMDKMHAYLVAIKQPLAAQKITRHHTGDRKGRWMICDCGYARVSHNNGHETHQRNLRILAQGLCGTKMNSGPFLAMLCKYASDYSEESHHRFIDFIEGLGTFQSIAIPDKSDYDLIQNMHSKNLISNWCVGLTKFSSHFHSPSGFQKVNVKIFETVALVDPPACICRSKTWSVQDVISCEISYMIF